MRTAFLLCHHTDHSIGQETAQCEFNNAAFNLSLINLLLNCMPEYPCHKNDVDSAEDTLFIIQSNLLLLEHLVQVARDRDRSSSICLHHQINHCFKPVGHASGVSERN